MNFENHHIGTNQIPIQTSNFFGINPTYQAFLMLSNRLNVAVGVGRVSDKTVVFLNKSGRELLELDNETPIHEKLMTDFHPEENWPRLKEGFNIAKKQGSWTGLVYFINFNTGEKIPTEMQLFFLTDNYDYIAMWARDLRKDIHIKQEKEYLEKTFHNFLNHSPAITYTKSLEGKYLDVNHKFESLTGLSYKEIIGHSDQELFFDEYVSKRQESEMSVLTSGKPSEIEDAYADQSGNTHYIRSMKFPMKDELGKPFALGSISVDITRKKEVERQLLDERKKALASSKLASLGEMAAGIAHEINNPLSIIAGKVSQIERRLKRGDSQESISADLKKITKTTDRISKIVRGFKSFAHDSDSEPYMMINFNELLDEIYEICHMRFKYKEIECIPIIEPNISFEARESQIFQVLINLLNNSFDAIKDKGGWIKLKAETDREHVFIDVIDSGDGISTDIQEKIFLPFYSSKGPARGTGLGLSISKTIVEGHQGKLTLDKGHTNTKFSIIFPKRRIENNQ